MRFPVTVLALSLPALLAACSGGVPHETIDHAALLEAQRQETKATQLAQHERERREFWQAATYTSSVAGIVLLIAGMAAGSRTRHAARTQA